MQVLLIDDNPIDLLVNNKIVTTLSPAVEVVKKQSAGEALSYLQNIPKGGQPPEYILLDIKMPIMDGFGFLIALKSVNDILENQTKIIMVSSSIDPMDRKRADENPLVFDFLEKPLSIEKLKNCEALKF